MKKLVGIVVAATLAAGCGPTEAERMEACRRDFREHMAARAAERQAQERAPAFRQRLPTAHEMMEQADKRALLEYQLKRGQ